MNKIVPINREQVGWIDLLRIVACFLVIISHSCDPFVGQFDNNHYEFLSGAYIGSIVRACVPLFVMISGILLLPINVDISTFYSKRTKRLLAPFIFWSLALPVIFFLYFNSDIEIINPMLIAEDHTMEMTLRKFYLFIFNFNFDTIPLWYVYMLVGLYLFMPIISPWLKQASQKDIRRFLFIWIVSMCLPYMQMLAPHLGYQGNYGSMGILGVCEWNAYGAFYYFSGFLGYIVLAYYLKRFPLDRSWKRTLWTAIPLFLIGYAITAEGFILTQKYFPGSYANLEIIWYFSGINVFLMTISIFIVFQKIKIKSSPILTKIASLTFGIYLCHFIFVQYAYDLIYPNINVPAGIKIFMIALFTFAVSLFVVWLMSMSKVMRKVIM